MAEVTGNDRGTNADRTLFGVNRRVLFFVCLVATLGAVVLVRAAADSRQLPLDPYVVLLAALTLATRRLTIKIPGHSATVSVSEVFVFGSILLFGPAFATLTVAVDGLWISFGHQDRRWHRTLFNIAEPAISTWTAGHAFFFVAQVPPLIQAHTSSPPLLLATFAMAAVFFTLNSTSMAIAVALESGSSAYGVWRGYAAALAINYYASASVAAIAVGTGRIDLQVVGLVIPLLLLWYFAYREASTRVDEAHRHSREVERLYEEARTRDDELRQAQKLEAIGRLAGGVAHDFNNMLTAIKGYGELLAGALDEGDRRRDDVDEILKAADRSVALTRQLLAFSRRQAIVPQVLSLGHVITDTEKMLRRVLGEDIVLTTAIDPGAGRVLADAGQIEQVLLNLAVNGGDAMSGGGTLRIELAAVQFDAGNPPRSNLPPGRYVRLSVADTGCGMSPDVVSHVFEPFFTTKEAGRGTGLGLATVYGIVTQAGGVLDIDTEVGRGTTFHLYFPETPAAEIPRGHEVPQRTSRRGSGTILVVEDEAAVLKFVASGLRKAGYTVLASPNGGDAIDVVRRHTDTIDLLLTDVVMPGMNGRELADEVLRARPDTRVLFMSGYTGDAVLRRGVEADTAGFLQKPFSLDDLAEKVHDVLSGDRCAPVAVA